MCMSTFCQATSKLVDMNGCTDFYSSHRWDAKGWRDI